LSADQQRAAANVAFTHGSVVAFMVGAAMILAGAVITFAFMRVSHSELATDGPPGAPVGLSGDDLPEVERALAAE
jgi:hypothetical protein